MKVYCGDCGTETRISGRFRICDTCRSSTMLAGRASGKSTRSGPNLQNVPIRTPQGRRIRDAFPKPSLNFDYEDLERKILFTGGGAVNTCHTCGCAIGECECQKP
jgi:hypothetical protein